MFSNINDIANLVGNESHRDCDDILTDPRNLVRVFLYYCNLPFCGNSCSLLIMFPSLAP